MVYPVRIPVEDGDAVGVGFDPVPPDLDARTGIQEYAVSPVARDLIPRKFAIRTPYVDPVVHAPEDSVSFRVEVRGPVNGDTRPMAVHDLVRPQPNVLTQGDLDAVPI